MMTSGTRRVAAAATAATALAFTLAGCSALSAIVGGGGGEAKRDDAGQIQEDQNIGIFSLKVGDCKLSDSGAQVDATDVVPCDQPHDEEVYFEFELEGDELPDAETIETAVLDNCIPAFQEYVGMPWEESVLDVRWLEPSPETWEQLDDRIVQCIIVDGSGEKLNASMKGAGI